MDQGALEGVAGAAQEGLTADAALRELRGRRGGASPDCRNCGTTLLGPHCHACGQLADSFHRPLWNLLGEGLEGLFSLDGRFWRTVPPLLYAPKRVTRSYLDGARARYVAPFRLFLFASLAFFLAFGFAMEDVPPQNFIDINSEIGVDQEAAPGDAASGAESRPERVTVRLGYPPERQSAEPPSNPTDASEGDVAPEGVADPLAQEEQNARGRREMKCQIRAALVPEAPDTPACAETRAAAAADGRTWGQDSATGLEALPRGIREHIASSAEITIDRPEAYIDAVTRLLPRAAFFMFPLLAILLALLHFWRRDLYLYDYTIAALHYHAALFLVLLIGIGLSMFIGVGLVIPLVLLWTQFWLYRLHRDVFRDSRFGSVVRVGLLDAVGMVVSLFTLLALLAAGLWTL